MRWSEMKKSGMRKSGKKKKKKTVQWLWTASSEER